MRTSLRGLAAVLPLVVLPVARLDHVRPARAEGYTFTIKVAGRDAQSEPQTLTLKIAGEKLRLEMDLAGVMGGGGGGGANPMAAMMGGAYMLPSADGKMTMVLPNMTMMGGNGMALSVNTAQMAGRGGPPPTAEGSVEDLGASESIASHSTHRYRFKAASGDLTEVWLSTDLNAVDFKKTVAAFGGMVPGINMAMIAKFPNGFPLKMVSTSKGVTATDWEVTSVEKNSFDDGVFSVPPGMSVMDGAAMMGGMMGGRGGRGGRGGF